MDGENGTIKIYDLGEGGVNVDDMDIAMPDNELRQTQNAQRHKISQFRKALRLRSGFIQFNSTPLGGAVLGGIDMALALTGGAPVFGGGGSGEPGGSGPTGTPIPGTPGPGGATGGFPAGYPSSASGGGGTVSGGGVFAPSQLFSGRRLLAIGRRDNTNPNHGGHGWYLSSVQFQDQAKKLSIAQGAGVNSTPPAPGPPSEGVLLPTGITSTGNGCVGKATVANGVLYYQATFDFTQSFTPEMPTIRKTDGFSDSLVCRIPRNASVPTTAGTTFATSIESMITKYGDGNFIYLTVYDRRTATVATDYSRVFQLNTITNELTEIFNDANPQNATLLGRVAYSTASFMDRVFVGTAFGAATVAGTNPVWFMLQPDPSVTDGFNPTRITADTGSVSNSTSDITCMLAYGGTLYYGTEERTKAGNTDFAHIGGIPADAAAGVSTPLFGSGGVAVDKNAFISMVIFKGNLYASYYNPTQTAKVYKFDGTTWTTVFTSAGVADRQPFNLQVDPDNGNPDTLYAFGSNGATTSYFMYTQDGSSWTNKTANLTGSLPQGDFGVSIPINVFLGFNQ